MSDRDVVEQLRLLLDECLSCRLLGTWHIVADPSHFGNWSSSAGTVLCHLMKGHLESEFVDDTSVPWHAGDLLCLRPSVIRRTRIASGSQVEMQGITVDMLLFAGMDPLSLYRVPRVFRGEAAAALAVLVQKIRETAEEPGQHTLVRAIASKALTFQLFRGLVEASEPIEDLADRIDQFDRLRPMVEAIHLDIARDWTIGELATLAGLSRSRLHVLFKQTFRRSPCSYLKYLRLKKAADLLVSSERTISEIAEAVGWEDPFYFSRTFKSAYGLAPRDFRKQRALRHHL